MADKRTTPETPEDASQAAPERPRRKKRAAPTIDLAAIEVPPPQDTGPQPDPPPATAEPTPEKTAPAETPPTRTGGTFGMAALAGGAAGVAAALLVLFGLDVAGLLPLRQVPSTTATQTAADNTALDALTQRVGGLEAQIRKLPSGDAGLADRLAAAEGAMKSLGVALTALSHRTDDIAADAGQARERADAAVKAIADLKDQMASTSAAGLSRADLDALNKRVAALESAAQSAQSDIGRIAAKSSGDDRAARLALSAASLRDAVAVGLPFTGELTTVKQLGGDDKALAPLAPFAASGVPSAPALAQELNALLPAIIKIANTSAPQGGFIERLKANAGKLMRFRPLNAPVGDDAASVLARLEIDTSKADIGAALTDLGKLDEPTRAPAQAWIGKARQRQAALAAARQFATDTARALGPKAAAQ